MIQSRTWIVAATGKRALREKERKNPAARCWQESADQLTSGLRLISAGAVAGAHRSCLPKRPMSRDMSLNGPRSAGPDFNDTSSSPRLHRSRNPTSAVGPRPTSTALASWCPLIAFPPDSSDVRMHLCWVNMLRNLYTSALDPFSHHSAVGWDTALSLAL